jgi:CRP/FNR family transcriptional regulator
LGIEVPEIGRTLFDVLKEFISRKNTHLLDLGRKRADERVASFLVEYGRRAPRENADGTSINLLVPRGTIADFLCLTRETVSRSFTQLREEGLINQNNHDEIDIIDFPALCRRASGDDSVGP